MSKKHRQLEKWKRKLGITADIRFEYIPRESVTCAYNRPYRLVGICNKCIYHDRRLKEVDIVHELVHFKDKRLSEKSVRDKVRELCG